MIKKILAALIVVIAAVSIGTAALASGESHIARFMSDDESYEVVVANNLGKRDSVKVIGIEPRSVVSVYEGKVLLGRKTAGASTAVNMNVTLSSVDGGNISVSVLNRGSQTPKTASGTYNPELVSEPPVVKTENINNNVGKKDTILIEGLMPRDTVTIYNERGKKLTSGKVRKNNNEATLSYKQFGTNETIVFITVTSVKMHESPEVRVIVPEEQRSEPFTAAEAGQYIEVINPVGKKGTIEISNLEPGDTVSLYSTQTGTKLLGSKKCAKNKDSVKISATLEKDNGNFYISIKRNNKLPSDFDDKERGRYQHGYEGQEKTEPLVLSQITPTNNPAGTNDTLYINGLEPGDIIKVYLPDKADSSKPASAVYMRGTVGANKTEVILAKAQFGTDEMILFVTNTRKSMRESNPIAVTVPKEQPSNALRVSQITVTNNAGIPGTVDVRELDECTTITVYDKGTNGRILGTAKVASGATSVTISTNSLSIGGGSVWVTQKTATLAESTPIEVTYAARKTTDELNYELKDSQVAIENNADTDSVITVTGLSEGDTLKVYENLTAGSPIVQAICANGFSVEMKTRQLKRTGSQSELTVYISLTKKGLIEGTRKAFTYNPVGISNPIVPSQIKISNNVSGAAVEVSGLLSGDIITVYAAATGSTTLGKGTVAESSSNVTFNITGLSTTAGDVWVTRKSLGLDESARTNVSYGAQSAIPQGMTVEIANNARIDSVITVNGLSSGDTVKVYSALSDSTPIAQASANGTGEATLRTNQLNQGGGRLYITVTQPDRYESARGEYSYAAQEVSAIPGAFTATKTSVVILEFSELNSGDEIRVYSDSAGTLLLGSATSGSGGTATITLRQEGAISGTVAYVTRTSPGKHESAIVAINYG